MSATPRYYKYYPQETIDLGEHPFEGDWTLSDRIDCTDIAGLHFQYFPSTTGVWGRNVTRRVGKRIQTVFEPGVTIGPIELSGVAYPTWFIYYGDGVCTVKLPNGDQPEPVET